MGVRSQPRPCSGDHASRSFGSRTRTRGRRAPSLGGTPTRVVFDIDRGNGTGVDDACSTTDRRAAGWVAERCGGTANGERVGALRKRVRHIFAAVADSRPMVYSTKVQFPKTMRSIDPQSLLPLKPETFHILLILADHPLHGYGIIQEVERETEGRIRLEPSPLYRRLKRLMDLEVVRQVQPDPPATDERRTYYDLTRFGHRVVEAEAARITQLAKQRSVKALAALATRPR